MFDTHKWYEDESEESDETPIHEYSITSSPNDFNVLTIYSFLESGAVKIPGFQRNYVWDIGRASKLIESIILGLPIPQIFLYELGRNEFVVIDGQQRLMSIYYFMKGRFPKKDKRTDLRAIFDAQGKVPNEIINDDAYFEDFRLRLPSAGARRGNPFVGLSYQTLGEYKVQFDLRTIRNVIIKQNEPSDDHSSMFEIFQRLNTGGVNLRPQEIRTSMYHSAFYNMLSRANLLPGWRRLLNSEVPDLHMKDIEILLRGFAFLVDGDRYAPSMVRFLNDFSRKCKEMSKEEVEYYYQLFESFLNACADLPTSAFLNKRNNRFNVALYDAAFAAICREAFVNQRLLNGVVSLDALQRLENDPDFQQALVEGTTQTRNVKQRLARARELLGAL